MQLQVELSGPSQGVQVSGNRVPDIATWQWQTALSRMNYALDKLRRAVGGVVAYEL
jgi:hypothetical protein